MTSFLTSRGTKITKVSETCEAVFTLDEIKSVQGPWPSELSEINRFKGTEMDLNYIRDNTVPNIQAKEAEIKEWATNEVNVLLPQTGTHDDPVVVEVYVDIGVRMRYTKAPFVETKVVEYNDQGEQIEAGVSA